MRHTRDYVKGETLDLDATIRDLRMDRFRAVLVNVLGVVTTVACMFLTIFAGGWLDALLPRSESMSKDMHSERMTNSVTHVFRMSNDGVDWSMSVQERYWTNKLSGVNVLLSDVQIADDFMAKLYDRHGIDLSKEVAVMPLHFLVKVVGDIVLEVKVHPPCQKVIYDRVAEEVRTHVNQLSAFRHGGWGEEHKRRVLQNPFVAALQLKPDDICAKTKEECLTDDEAIALFCHIASRACLQDHPYDYNAIFEHIPFDMWNRDRPIISAVVVILFLVALVMFIAFVRPVLNFLSDITARRLYGKVADKSDDGRD